MTLRRLSHRTRGFSLIEVLIALVVLAAGFVAIAKFQATVFGYSADAKERAIAARLAEESIADLRHYQVLPVTAGSIAYRGIGNNTGGTGTRPSGTVTVSNVAYTRNWTVADYYYPNTGLTPAFGVAATTAVPATPPAHPPFKLVTVTIGWTDQRGIARNIAVSTLISAHNPAMSGRTIH